MKKKRIGRSMWGWCLAILIGSVAWLGGLEACNPPSTAEKQAEATGEKQADASKQEVTAEAPAEPQEGQAEAKAEVPSPPDGSPETPGEATPEPPKEAVAEGPPQGPHTIMLFDKTIIHSTGDTNVRNAFKNFSFFHTTFEKVFLHVKLDTTCFPFETWQKNPPPPGHNWPASCDAFDRNFEFVLNPAEKEGDPPGFELVRAITPFGGPMTFAVDVTDLANHFKGGSHRIRAHIATWSDGQGKVSGSAGQWEVSAWLEVVPGVPPRKILLAKALSDHSYNNKTGQMIATFTLPAGATKAVIEYRATGHGGGAVGAGCIGPADEFCRRTHALSLDGAELFKNILWRDDCQRFCTLQTQGTMQYCKENPCGSIGSVRAPRANWCPGGVTLPLRLTLPTAALPKTEPQVFSYEVLNVGEGGSWRISSTLLVYGD